MILNNTYSSKQWLSFSDFFGAPSVYDGRGEILMKKKFFALVSRMKYIERWALMRNIERENIAEHSYFVAVLCHALCVIRRDIFGIPCNPEKAIVHAIFHDTPEILTGDLPTPVKYFNPEIRNAYQKIEQISIERLLSTLPDEMIPEYRMAMCEFNPYQDIIKAADKLAALIKCVEERNSGNTEFSKAEETTRKHLIDMDLPEVNYFLEHFIEAFELTLDDLQN